MKTYRVTIRATVTKTLTVKAGNEHDACLAAHEDFSVLHTDEYEDYTQKTLEVEEDKA
jgi:hypothetical protein